MKLNIGENIRRMRASKGVTQEKLAEALGVSCQSVSRWELNICYPDMELLPTLANYFGISIDKLLSNDTDSKEADQQRFYDKFEALEFGSLEQLQFVEEYYHKYPDNDRFAFILQDIMKNYLLVNKDKTANYLPTMVKLYERVTCLRLELER